MQIKILIHLTNGFLDAMDDHNAMITKMKISVMASQPGMIILLLNATKQKISSCVQRQNDVFQRTGYVMVTMIVATIPMRHVVVK